MVSGNTPSFTAHNIRLDDGSQTMPSIGFTMDQHPWMASSARLSRFVFGPNLAGRSVIDVGCLEGGYSVEFARLGMNALGIEVRDSNIAACNYVKNRVNLPNLRFVQDDAYNIGKYGEADVFFVCGLLYHLDKPRQFLETVARNCRRLLILNTHISLPRPTPAIEQHRLSDMTENEGLPGRWYPEHNETDPTKIDALRWSSYRNSRAFWVQKEYLLDLVRQLGFDLVFEQFDCWGNIAHELTTGMHALADRTCIIGIKSKP